VAQNSESNGRTVAAARSDSDYRQIFHAENETINKTDIVIAVTPRGPARRRFCPKTKSNARTGVCTPTSGSLEALVIQEEIEEQLAAARRLPRQWRKSNCPTKSRIAGGVKSDALTTTAAAN